MSERVFALSADRMLVYDVVLRKGREVDVPALVEEVTRLAEDVKRLEERLKDQRALLTWAREEYPFASGLERLKTDLAEKQTLLKACSLTSPVRLTSLASPEGAVKP